MNTKEKRKQRKLRPASRVGKVKPFRPNLDIDGNGNTNAVRADRADEAVEAYRQAGGYGDPDTNEEQIQDLINDLCHLLHSRKENVYQVIGMALSGWMEESGGGGNETAEITLRLA